MLKLFVDERGSDAMRRFADGEGSRGKVVSALARVEASSAICRLRRDGRLTESEAVQILNDIAEEIRIVNEQPVTKQILDAAVGLMSRRAIRSLDAIQLGSALILRDTTAGVGVRFISADYGLLAAAQAEGFLTWDPAVLA